ncbi:Nuclear factor of activated T-cells 5 [Holothuria leucospilota]|uniref:Nuclear factor of activated T-cells 5 n=1 Tax=Holothuria leucospilota TaxID=206669 RepID=A0A9Q1BEP9_HOLLE|nr:Nuclear factor of activated T-cells 5 [Holothuria leucospilota]
MVEYFKTTQFHDVQLNSAMKIGFLLFFLSIGIGTAAVTANQDCENPTNGANSCGSGTFWNNTETTCTPCPLGSYRDSTNHNCEDCKPCSTCEEGWISADPDGCPPDQDTKCVPAGYTNYPTKPLSSTPAQPHGQAEIKRISPLEYSVAGGEELIILGENFRRDCDVKVLDLSDDGTSVWNGTCEIDKRLFHHTYILCTMPPYKDEHPQQPATVYVVITCEGGYSSQLMDHPIIYNPVPDGQEQNDDQQNRGSCVPSFFMGVGVSFAFFLVVAVIVWCIKKKKDWELVVNHGDGQQSEETTELTSNGDVESAN